jgi:hypothetical protein
VNENYADHAVVCHTEARKYHRWSEISCSQLKLLARSPLRFYHRYVERVSGETYSSALTYGTLLHAYFELGTEEFYRQAQRPDPSLLTKSGSLSVKGQSWAMDLPKDAFILTPDDEKKLKHQVSRLMELEPVREILAARTDAEFNVRFNWGGHACRSRVDGATPSFFYDWKTTRVEDPLNEFARHAVDLGYHMQAAMYEAARLAMGHPRSRMVFIVTSTAYPHECCCVRLPHDLIELGRQQCLRLLDELKCRQEWGFWHRYETQEISELKVPAYLMKGV